VNLDLIGENANFFLRAGGYALVIFVASTAASIFFSAIVGMLATVRVRAIQVVIRGIVELVRGVPQVISLFFVYFGAPTFGLQLTPLEATIVSLSLWGSANGAEIVRGGINAVPRHQLESARSLGVTRLDVFRFVILPQAVRPIVPAYAGLCNMLMHSTSLGALVGVTELLKSGQIVIERAEYFHGGSPGLTIYGFLLVVYFLAGLTMNAGVARLERRLGVPTQRS
jgi:polar amino acid transport system permease protein